MDSIIIKKEDQFKLALLLKAVPALLALISFLVGGIFTFSMFTKNIATVQYVDSKHEETIKLLKDSIESLTKYADRVSNDGMNRAFEHSDMNKKDMTIRIESFGSKLDLMLDTVKTIQNQMYESRRR